MWSSRSTEYRSTGCGCQSCSWSSEKENFSIFSCPCSRLENLVSQDRFGRPVPRQPAHLHTQAESDWSIWCLLTGFILLSATAPVYTVNRHHRISLECVCVCVCCLLSSHLFWTSGLWACTSRSHTRFLHFLPAVLALIFLAKRIQPFLSLVDREVEFSVLTNQSFSTCWAYLFIFEEKSQFV